MLDRLLPFKVLQIKFHKYVGWKIRVRHMWSGSKLKRCWQFSLKKLQGISHHIVLWVYDHFFSCALWFEAHGSCYSLPWHFSGILSVSVLIFSYSHVFRHCLFFYKSWHHGGSLSQFISYHESIGVLREQHTHPCFVDLLSLWFSGAFGSSVTRKHL